MDTLKGKCFKVVYEPLENVVLCPICDSIVEDYQEQCEHCGAWLDWINE